MSYAVSPVPTLGWDPRSPRDPGSAQPGAWTLPRPARHSPDRYAKRFFSWSWMSAAQSGLMSRCMISSAGRADRRPVTPRKPPHTATHVRELRRGRRSRARKKDFGFQCTEAFVSQHAERCVPGGSSIFEMWGASEVPRGGGQEEGRTDGGAGRGAQGWEQGPGELLGVSGAQEPTAFAPCPGRGLGAPGAGTAQADPCRSARRPGHRRGSTPSHTRGNVQGSVLWLCPVHRAPCLPDADTEGGEPSRVAEQDAGGKAGSAYVLPVLGQGPGAGLLCVTVDAPVLLLGLPASPASR